MNWRIKHIEVKKAILEKKINEIVPHERPRATIVGIVDNNLSLKDFNFKAIEDRLNSDNTLRLAFYNYESYFITVLFRGFGRPTLESIVYLLDKELEK